MAKALDKHSDTQMMPKQASKRNVILVGDCIEQLKTLPDESIDCCVTSPPYYGLRNYGVDGQIGLEETPGEYIGKLVEAFREVRRVLKNDGTLWLNIGDSYCNSNGYARASEKFQRKGRNDAPANDRDLKSLHESGLKTKDLIGIPWMLAFALRADGWYLRQDIIWSKPNPMPESVKDRCTKSHEYVFLLSKSQKYFYDSKAISEKSKWVSDKRSKEGRIAYKGKRSEGGVQNTLAQTSFVSIPSRKNKRSVWTIPVKPVKEAHFATFPEKLVEPCILAGCRPGGIVLDPFFGSGTTGIVAMRYGRYFLGIELNPKYVEIANSRTGVVQMSFTEQEII